MITSAAAMLALAASPGPPAAGPPNFPTCGAVVEQPCRIPNAISAVDARRWLGDRDFVWRIDGDTLKVVATGTQPPQLCCTFQTALEPVPDASGVWELTVRAPRLNEAVVDVVLLSPTGSAKLNVWRGPNAPPPAPRQAPPAEWIHSVTLDSKALGEKRRVEIYAPPADGTPRPVIYLADGGYVRQFAAIAHGLALQGLAREPILIGLEVGPADPAPGQPGYDPQRSDLQRSQEYLLGFEGGEARFAGHERFLLEEVLPYAESTWGAPADPALRAVLGESNGAAWALAMAVRHPEVFDTTIALSFGWGKPILPVLKDGRIRNAYLGVGLYEGSMLGRTRDAAAALIDRTDRLRLEVRPAGHSPTAWEDQFAQALEWAFPAIHGTPRGIWRISAEVCFPP
jgi:enterochelin esterase-like enzyme